MSDKNGTKLRDERQKSTANTIRSQTFTRIHNQYRHTDTDTNTSSSIEPQLSHSQSRALFLFLRFKLLKAAAHRFLCIYIYFWNNYTNTKKFPPMLWFGFVSSFQMEQESQHGILCYHTVRLSHFRIEFWNDDRALEVLFTPLICFDEKKKSDNRSKWIQSIQIDWWKSSSFPTYSSTHSIQSDTELVLKINLRTLRIKYIRIETIQRNSI